MEQNRPLDFVLEYAVLHNLTPTVGETIKQMGISNLNQLRGITVKSLIIFYAKTVIFSNDKNQLSDALSCLQKLFAKDDFNDKQTKKAWYALQRVMQYQIVVHYLQQYDTLLALELIDKYFPPNTNNDKDKIFRNKLLIFCSNIEQNQSINPIEWNKFKDWSKSCFNILLNNCNPSTLAQVSAARIKRKRRCPNAIQSSQKDKYSPLYLKKEQRILLINGFINSAIYSNNSEHSRRIFRYSDILNLIQLYYNDSIFTWHLNMQKLSSITNDYGSSIEKERPICAPKWPIEFYLKVWPMSKPRFKIRRRIYGPNYWGLNIKEKQFADIELSPAVALPIFEAGARPLFMKIYYELNCKEIQKISFWKGVKKYRAFYDNGYLNWDCQDSFLLIPRKFLERSELVNQQNVTMNIFIKFLCIQWPENVTNSLSISSNSKISTADCINYVEDITISQNVKFKWHISNNHKMFENFKRRKHAVLFSKNFDNDIWCLYCKNVQNPTNKKQLKFCIGLMLIKLPWYLNYVKIQLIVRCNDELNQKEVIKKAWPGFESALQIPFKYTVLQESSALDITVKFKILDVFDHNDKKLDMRNIIH